MENATYAATLLLHMYGMQHGDEIQKALHVDRHLTSASGKTTMQKCATQSSRMRQTVNKAEDTNEDFALAINEGDMLM